VPAPHGVQSDEPLAATLPASHTVGVQRCSEVFVSVTLVYVSGASAQSVTLLSVHAAASTAVAAGCGISIVRPLTTAVDEFTAPAKYRPALAMPLVAAAVTVSCAMLMAQSRMAGSSTWPRAATFVSDTAAPVVSVAEKWATRTAWTAAAAPPLVAATVPPAMARDPPGSMPSTKSTAAASPGPVCVAAIATPPLTATRPPTG
jgi:hypothetical protein